MMATTQERDTAAAELGDGQKRLQIIDGARAMFLAQGFDGASMGEIARKAGVSKGTLYVYFDSKEDLFQVVAHEECLAQAEQVFQLDPADHDVSAVLARLGTAFVKFLCQPSRLAAVRTVMSISERMPDIGRKFYETGPAVGIGRVAAYIEAQRAAGVLDVEDTEVAAAQFLESCTATLVKPMLFGFGVVPDQTRIDHVVGIAVRLFLAAYCKR
ncbi:MAG TPA: TetR/AcrR family transcriptional regulator [Reyranella sp.]|jgi:AcrR family transcriptional regulator